MDGSLLVVLKSTTLLLLWLLCFHRFLSVGSYFFCISLVEKNSQQDISDDFEVITCTNSNLRFATTGAKPTWLLRRNIFGSWSLRK